MPDIIDGAAWPLRGELGQWLGHSLVGIAVACVPVGFVLTWLARRVVSVALLARLDGNTSCSRARACTAVSLAFGALTHLLFDLVTHGSFRMLWPWYTDEHAFPAWWYRSWGDIPLPVYSEPYPFAPHTVAWIVLTVVGAAMFVCHVRATPERPRRSVRAAGREPV